MKDCAIYLAFAQQGPTHSFDDYTLWQLVHTKLGLVSVLPMCHPTDVRNPSTNVTTISPQEQQQYSHTSISGCLHSVSTYFVLAPTWSHSSDALVTWPATYQPQMSITQDQNTLTHTSCNDNESFSCNLRE